MGLGLECFQCFETVSGFGVAEVLPLGEDDEEFEINGVVIDKEDTRGEIFTALCADGGCGCVGRGEGTRSGWQVYGGAGRANFRDVLQKGVTETAVHVAAGWAESFVLLDNRSAHGTGDGTLGRVC